MKYIILLSAFSIYLIGCASTFPADEKKAQSPDEISQILQEYQLTNQKTGEQSGSIGVSGSESVNIDNTTLTLSDYLKRTAGVQVQQLQGQTLVRIRGLGTFSDSASSNPLFIIDGIQQGRDIDAISSFVDINDIDHINILKGVDSSQIYGFNGAHGAIEIFTKK